MLVTQAAEKIIHFYRGNVREIDHTLKVWALARPIGGEEGLLPAEQEELELAALIHDIACPLCREKYGSAPGDKQELESPPLVRAFFEGMGIPAARVERLAWLAAHHHTYTGVDGPVHRILLEADYLVNAGERGDNRETIAQAGEHFFRTEAGKRLLRSMYLREE